MRWAHLYVVAVLSTGCGKACGSSDAPTSTGVDASAVIDAGREASTDAARTFSAEEMRHYADALKRGRTLTLQKKYPDAIAAFDAALAVMPTDPHATAERGYAKLLSGDAAHAEHDFVLALKLAPMAEKKFRAQVYFNFGLVNEKQGHDDEAQSDFRTSYEYNPTPQAKAKMSPCPAIFSTVVTTPYATRAAAVAAFDAGDESPSTLTVCQPDDTCIAILPVASGVVVVDGTGRDRCVEMDPADCTHIERQGDYWVIELRSASCSRLCGCDQCNGSWEECESQCEDSGTGMWCGQTTCMHATPHAMMWIDGKTGAGLWSVEWDPQFIGQINASVSAGQLTVTGAGCNVHRAPPKPP